MSLLDQLGYALEAHRRSVEYRTAGFQRSALKTITISDSEGLQYLRERTSRFEADEWAAAFHFETSGKTALIDRIDTTVPSPFFEKDPGSYIGMIGHFRQMRESGFNGFHHYHPSVGFVADAADYAINPTDAFRTKDSLGLLSFNVGCRSELIAYQGIDVFLPITPAKDSFAKAGFWDTMKYLRGK